MPTIAIITKNKCNFDRMEEFAFPLLYREHNKNTRRALKEKLNDYIWSVMAPYISFVTITNNDDFFLEICHMAQNDFPDMPPEECMYHTEGSYSTPKRFMELIYSEPQWKSYENSITHPEIMNNIGCLFSLSHHVIENSCIIIANEYDLSQEKYVKMGSITKDDIIRVIRRRYFHTAILIKENSVVKYYYQKVEYLLSVIYGVQSTEESHINTVPCTHLKYNLVFYFNKCATQYVNQIATRINGNQRMYGDVLVLHEMDEGIYANLNIREIKRLNVLSYGSLDDRLLQESEVCKIPVASLDVDGQEQDESVPLWSRYIVIANRLAQWQLNKNICMNCQKHMEQEIVCQQCFRTKCCTTACHDQHMIHHTTDCIKD